MNRTKILRVVNPILGVLLANQACTGLLHGHLSDEAFEWLHERSGIALVLVVVAHVMLNWNWVRANFLKRPAAPGG